MRIASTTPNVWYPVTRPGIKSSETQARDRRQVSFGWWEQNKVQIQLRRRARWFVAYTSAPVLLTWDQRKGCPRWQPMSPLGTYPGRTADLDDVHPPDCIFTFQRTLGWLQQSYPEEARRLKRGNMSKDSPVELVLYADDAQVTLGAYTPTVSDAYTEGNHVHLSTVDNRAGVPLAVVPGRITLDRPMGMIDSMVGQYLQEAEFMALGTIAARKAIFPDLWLVAPNGGNAQIVKPANGLRGEVGKVVGGTIQPIQPQPGYLTMPMMDRLRENQRLTAGIPSDLTGEAGTNVRTGRRANQLVSAVVDFPVQEAQEMFAASLQAELVVASAIDKAYTNGSKTFHVSWKGARGSVTYTASDLWDDAPAPVVDYAYAGTDTNGLVIEAGQRIGMGTLSKQSFMEVDPLVADAEMEHDRIVNESLEAAMMQSIQQQAAAGQIPPADLSRIMALVITDRKSLADAVEQVHREAQERQAAQVAPSAPEAQPGLAQPGAGAEGSIAAPAPGIDHLNELMMQLRGPSRQTPAEMASVTG
jgi:hypothetical protein